jgi:hypothetical protein
LQQAQLDEGYLLIPAAPATQPMAGQYVCFLGGDFGFEPLADAGALGRLFLFRVTSGAPGRACINPTLDMNLKGCIYRTSTDAP